MTDQFLLNNLDELGALLDSLDHPYSGIHMEKRRDGKIEIEVTYDE